MWMAITIRQWFENHYNNHTDEKTKDLLELRKLKKHADFHRKFTGCFSGSHRNYANRDKRIIHSDAVVLLP